MYKLYLKYRNSKKDSLIHHKTKDAALKQLYSLCCLFKMGAVSFDEDSITCLVEGRKDGLL